MSIMQFGPILVLVQFRFVFEILDQSEFCANFDFAFRFSISSQFSFFKLIFGSISFFRLNFVFGSILSQFRFSVQF